MQRQGRTSESAAVKAEIEARFRPQSQVIVAILQAGSDGELRRQCFDYQNGSVYVEDELTFQTRINQLASSRLSRKHLCLIVGPALDTLHVRVPALFTRFEVIACSQPAAGPSLIVDSESTYAGIPLPRWTLRTTHLDHEFCPQSPGVVVELSDEGVFDDPATAGPPPFRFQRDEDIDAATAWIGRNLDDGGAESEPGQQQQQSRSIVSPGPANNHRNGGILPWIAGGLGAAAGAASAGAVLISSVKMAATGLYITAGSWSIGWGTASLTAGAAVAAGAATTGVLAGAGVAAAVYFIPWRKLASWLLDAFGYFCKFLRSLWATLMKKLEWIRQLLTAIWQFLTKPASAVMNLASWASNTFFGGSGRSQAGASGPVPMASSASEGEMEGMPGAFPRPLV